MQKKTSLAQNFHRLTLQWWEIGEFVCVCLANTKWRKACHKSETTKVRSCFVAIIINKKKCCNPTRLIYEQSLLQLVYTWFFRFELSLPVGTLAAVSVCVFRLHNSWILKFFSRSRCLGIDARWIRRQVAHKRPGDSARGGQQNVFDESSKPQ